MGRGLAPSPEKVHFIMLQMQKNTKLSAVRNGRNMHIHIFISILIFALFVCDDVSMVCSKTTKF